MKLFYKSIYLLLILFFLFVIRNYISSKYSNNINFKYTINDNSNITDYINYSYARLYYQNPYEYNEYIYILSNNVKEKDYVVSSDGLIGIISNTYNNYAKVKLITSNDLTMQVMINECYGIYNNSYVSNYDDKCSMSIGNIVYTSNLDYQNKKIEIGTISNIVVKNNKEIYQVKLNINLNNLNNLLIISRNIT